MLRLREAEKLSEPLQGWLCLARSTALPKAEGVKSRHGGRTGHPQTWGVIGQISDALAGAHMMDAPKTQKGIGMEATTKNGRAYVVPSNELQDAKRLARFFLSIGVLREAFSDPDEAARWEREQASMLDRPPQRT